MGFTKKDSIFNSFYQQINNQVAQAIEKELKTEIASNYGQKLLNQYLAQLKIDGFRSPTVQDWLESHIPTLRQIEIEWREIVLDQLVTQTNHSPTTTETLY